MDFNLKGTIVYDDDAAIYRHYGYNEIVCPADLQNFLDTANGADVRILINSDGGYMDAGLEMYGLIKAYKGKVTAIIQSRSASSATIVMMAAAKIVCEPPGRVLIHDPFAYSAGDAGDHRKTAQELETLKETIINAYMTRSKLTRDEISTMMSKDAWMTPQEAKSHGLIDEIINEDLIGDIVYNSKRNIMMLTPKMRELFNANKNIELKNENEAKRLLAKCRLAMQ